ncbi:Gfo/Idh/MocA family protein [Ruania alba]|uniref:Predicted dehydrogenase n=1 Tax=Ruania alba TaxID=648782 RepID=A0A1H5NBU4_9MICO|nr:Gfo/Idh/MocA family oxidoreductase [Ruania alba]SEE99112.1 Predicted dehydrogenase [Ruania alba]
MSRAPIALLGLATSHPYSDAATLLDLHPGTVFDVWEPDGERLAMFEDRFPGHRAHTRVEDALAQAAGAIVTVRPHQVAQVLAQVTRREVPAFVNKPVAVTGAQRDALEPIWTSSAQRLFTSSVLRFAAEVEALRGELDLQRVLSAHVTVRHDVGRWTRGSTPWQDDPTVGGGLIGTMGLHGVELLVSLLGPHAHVVSSTMSTRWHQGLVSGDTGTLTIRWEGGILGTISIVGVTEHEGYEIDVETVDGPRRVHLPAGTTDPLGYRATTQRFVAMVDEAAPSPVPWEQTRAVVDLLAEAITLSAVPTR